MSLFRNSSIVLAGTLVANVLAYAFHFIAGRMLGPEGYGQLGALLAFFAIIAIPLSGINISITKHAAIYNSKGDRNAIGSLKDVAQRHLLVIIGICLIPLVFFSETLATLINVDSNISIILSGVVVLPNAVYNVNLSILTGVKQYKTLSVASMIESVLRLILLLLLVFWGVGYIAGIMAFGISYLMTWFFTQHYVLFENKSKRSDINTVSFYKFAGQALLYSMIMQLILNIPSLLVSFYYNNELTGYWTAALNIAKIPLLFTTALVQVLFAEASSEKDKRIRSGMLLNSFIILLGISLSFLIVFFIFPEFLIRIIYGASYLGAAPLLGYMGVYILLYSVLHLVFYFRMASVE